MCCNSSWGSWIKKYGASYSLLSPHRKLFRKEQVYSHRAEAVIHTNINNNRSPIVTVHFFHKLSLVLQKLKNILHLVDYCTHRLKYGVRSPKFIWAPCHVMCTVVLIG